MKPLHLYLLVNVCVVGFSIYATWDQPLSFVLIVLIGSLAGCNFAAWLGIKTRRKRYEKRP
jgi:hypothetical protein